MYDDDNDLKDEEKELSATGMHVVGETDDAEDSDVDTDEEEDEEEDDEDEEEGEDE